MQWQPAPTLQTGALVCICFCTWGLADSDALAEMQVNIRGPGFLGQQLMAKGNLVHGNGLHQDSPPKLRGWGAGAPALIKYLHFEGNEKRET